MGWRREGLHRHPHVALQLIRRVAVVAWGSSRRSWRHARHCGYCLNSFVCLWHFSWHQLLRALGVRSPEAGDRHRSMQSTLPTASLSMLQLHASIEQPNPPQDVLNSRMNWEFGDLEKRDQETIVYYPVGIAMWLHYMLFWNMYVHHGANLAINAPPYPR